METDDFSSNEVDPVASLRPALTILYHPDLDRIADGAVLELPGGASLDLSRETPMFVAPRGEGGRPLEHACVSRTPLRLTSTAGGGVRLDPSESRTKLSYQGEPLGGELT